MAHTAPRLLAARRRLLRRGNIIVMTCLFMVVLLAMVAFGVDVGYIVNARTEIQRATDSAALAGAGELINGTTAARAEALDYLGRNTVGGRTLSASNATTEFGIWNSTSRTFTLGGSIPNAIRVTTTDAAQPLFFGRVLGANQFDATASAIATYQPRDIALVLDYSGSMCFDSQLLSINSLGRSTVENNLKQIWQQLGSPTFGTLTWAPQNYGGTNTSNTSVKSKFALTNVAWPLPQGSWDAYINYVKTDYYVNAAGYQCDYGMLTMINYVLSDLNTYAQCPYLWNTSEQPITALKDSVDVFLSFLQSNSTDDRVALSIYSYSNNLAILEKPLTNQFSQISTVVRQRQAGHYVGGTNMSAGMNKGRLEIQANARVGAKKMMVLMTDGVPTLPTGITITDKLAVITEANACAAAKIPVVAISLGADADTALMQQIADITGGAAFIIPGGQTATQVQAQLEAVFSQVAADRPLKLVK